MARPGTPPRSRTLVPRHRRRRAASGLFLNSKEEVLEKSQYPVEWGLDHRSSSPCHPEDSGSASSSMEYSDERTLPSSAIPPMNNGSFACCSAMGSTPPVSICTTHTINRILNRSASLDSDMCELVVGIFIKDFVLLIPSATRTPPGWTSHRVKMPTRNVHLHPSLGKRRATPLRRLGENGLSRAWGHSADTNMRM